MHNLAELISAIASLAWPVMAIAIVWLFKTELRALLSRFRKGKFFGTEVELDELQAKAVAAEAKVELQSISASSSPTIGNFQLDATATVGPDLAQDAIEEVLREAGRSPRLGLMLLSSKIERAARQLGVSRDRPFLLSAVIDVLVRTEQIPLEAAEALNRFNKVRDRIVHGHDADDDEIARAIDSGIRLLRLLLSLRPAKSETNPPELTSSSPAP